MEITRALFVDEEQLHLLDLHSFVNLFSVLTSNLQLLQLNSARPAVLDPIIDEAIGLSVAMRDKNLKLFNKDAILDFQFWVLSTLINMNKTENKANVNFDRELDTFTKIFEVMNFRTDELMLRWENPDRWELFEIDDFAGDFRKFFLALEKNSNGRYRFSYDSANKTASDYLINLNINSDTGNTIAMMLLFKDSIRDLVANARKYTLPGGEIGIDITMKNGLLRFVVQDSGIGIPTDQIERVVDFGYRASNVKYRFKTMGGGYGLTKAYYFIKRNGGRMWIDSVEGAGTRVTAEITIPPDSYCMN